ncbi:acylphosphatase-1 isoform X2 [Alosa alosa]|uniref:acylphosphatase-1 isoform X2 n=1 Tax=Alosa alosa TaxID=278164 RepID=UPI00201543B0|nr:acylphosphatase-1 isoform X2 [Alosa alosa]
MFWRLGQRSPCMFGDYFGFCWVFLVAPVVVILLAMSTNAGDSEDAKYASVDFEIFGNVQGVCFRMYTEDHGKKLGVNGWVKNTRQGTVIGQVQGPPDKVKEISPARDASEQKMCFLIKYLKRQGTLDG